MVPGKTEIAALKIDRSRARRGRGWGWLAALAVVLAALAGGFWWMRSQAAPEVQVVEAAVSSAPAGPSAGTTVLNASGYVEARRRATVASKITGRLTDVRVEEGLPVEEGAILARLDDRQVAAALALSEAQLAAARKTSDEIRVQLELAKITLRRTQDLSTEGFASDADLDRDRAQVDALTARLALEREQVTVAEREVVVRRTELDDTVIRAPFSGIVISKDAQEGEMVSPMSAGGAFTRTGICTIVDMGSLEIEVDVNESYIARVRPDQKVEAVLDAYPDWKIGGRVITTIPAADRQKATVLVRIAFDALDPRILPDMGVKVAFLEPEAESHDGAVPQARARLVVPEAAVRQDRGRTVVFVLTDDKVERRAVKTGAVGTQGVEVVSGLSAGERVVVAGPDSLADGARVRVR